jgi:glycosyltransferase involved in cell wall biosynthesis
VSIIYVSDMAGDTNTLSEKKKILFLVSEDWYFCSHRLPLARAARDAGFDVVVATRIRMHGAAISAEGFKLIPLALERKSRNFLHELLAIFAIFKIYRTERPDIVHQVALKPVLYGSISAYLARVPLVVNALAGMGYVFTSDQFLAKALRPVVRILFGVLLNRQNSKVIVQNPDDRAMLIGMGIKKERICLIRGSGVDTVRFSPKQPPGGPPVVMLASRMLWDKGVREFVDAAKDLKDKGVQARFVLVGESDPDNPTAVSKDILDAWQKEGAIEWWGHKENMPEVFSQAHVICLPSYREGLPMVLLEAASCGCPIIATDVPGCREIVRDGVNGLLVPPRDHIALAGALIALIENAQLREEMGRRGREIAVAEFSVEKVVSGTLPIYRELPV